MPKKGAVFGFQEIIAAILVIVSFIFVIQFLVQSKTGLDTKLSDFCAKSPESFLCDGKTETITLSDQIASKSTEALACAVNSVSAGKEQSCLSSFPAQKASQETKETDKNTFRPVGIECEVEEIYGSTNSFTLKPDRRVKNCNVQNFNLPQEVSKAEDWIPYYGDPKYLVYWQKFPIDEDTWTYKSDWKMHALIGVVSVAPPLRVGGVIAKSGLLKAASTTKFGANLITKYGGETTLKSLASKQVGKNFLKESMREVIAGRLKGGKFLLTIGAAEGADKIAELVDSVLGKYDPKPGKIVLKSPSFVNEKILEFGISKETERVPVLTKFKPKAFQELAPAHLASPCRIAILPIKETEVSCSAYSFNLETKEIGCHEPEELTKDDRSSMPTCQDFDNYAKLENEFSQSFIDHLKQMQSSEIPSSLRNYLTDRDIGGGLKEATIIAKALIHKGVFLQIYGRNAILKDSDRIIFETRKGPVDIKIGSIEQRSNGVSTGDATYGKATIHISKACKGDDKYKDVDKYFENDSDFEKLSCLVSLTFTGDCEDGSEVCEKFNGLQLELATTENGRKDVKFRFDLQKEPPDSADNGRRIEVSNDNYRVEYLDMDYDNVFESVVIATGDSKKQQIIQDSNLDGKFESFQLGNCKTKAAYADIVAAEKKEGYCVRNEGKIGIALEYGGYALVGAGAVIAIGSGLGVLGGSVAAYAAPAFVIGELATTASEVIKPLMGSWPSN